MALTKWERKRLKELEKRPKPFRLGDFDERLEHNASGTMETVKVNKKE